MTSWSRILIITLLLNLYASGSVAGSRREGEICLQRGDDPGNAAAWVARDATCQSGACYPGFAVTAVMKPGGDRVAWYCMRKDRNCVDNEVFGRNEGGINEGMATGPALCTCDPRNIGTGRCQGIVPPGTHKTCDSGQTEFQNDVPNKRYVVWAAWGPSFSQRTHFAVAARSNECFGPPVTFPFKYCAVTDGIPSCAPDGLVAKPGGKVEFVEHRTDKK